MADLRTLGTEQCSRALMMLAAIVGADIAVCGFESSYPFRIKLEGLTDRERREFSEQGCQLTPPELSVLKSIVMANGLHGEHTVGRKIKR